MKKKTADKRKKRDLSPVAISRTRRARCVPQQDAAPDPHYTESEAISLARQKVINATPAITDAIIEQAKHGGYQHARMLFDFIGLTCSPPATPEAEPLNPFIESLAQALGLKIPDLPGTNATGTAARTAANAA